jgi:hypothetical protein
VIKIVVTAIAIKIVAKATAGRTANVIANVLRQLVANALVLGHQAIGQIMIGEILNRFVLDLFGRGITNFVFTLEI